MVPLLPRRAAFAVVAALLSVPVLAVGSGAAVVTTARQPRGTARASAPRVAIVATSLPVVETGEPLAVQLAAVGGTPPYQWSPVALPAGVTISSTGEIAGAPSAAGPQKIQVEVVDALNATATATLVLDVRPGPLVATAALADGMVGADYATRLAARGGTPPYSWSVATGRLAGGLVLASSGLLAGRPGTPGTTTFDARVTDALGAVATAQLSVVVAPAAAEGYVTLDVTGQAVTYAMSAPPTLTRKSWHASGIAATPDGDGYWLVSTTGHVYGVGGARSLGSVPPRMHAGRIAGIAATPDGDGYWLVSATGRVFAFGGAQLLGSIPPRALVGSVTGIAAARTGMGYWLATSTGRVYRFGAARRLGWVTPGTLVGSIVGIAAVPGAPGYWLADANGQVYAYGAARHLAAYAGNPDHGVVAIAPAPADAGPGYWLLTRSGGVYGFGAARNMTPTNQQVPGASRAVALAASS